MKRIHDIPQNSKPNKKKAKQAAPITPPTHYSKEARTAANKQRRMAREAAFQLTKTLEKATNHGQHPEVQVPIITGLFYLAQRKRAQQIHTEVEQKVKRVAVVKLAKTMFSMEERARVVAS